MLALDANACANQARSDHAIVFGAADLGVRVWRGDWKNRTVLLVGLSCVFILYLDLVGEPVAASFAGRSTPDFAGGTSPHQKPDDRLVLYDTELESLLFYLKISAPIWTVWSEHRTSVTGSFYLAEKGVRSVSGPDPGLLTVDQFAEQLSKVPAKHVAVFSKQKI